MNKVGIIKCAKYDEDLIRTSLLSLIEKTDFPLVKDKSVLIKVNVLSDSDYNKHITTHPLVVKALIKIIQERGAKEVLVGDSPGITPLNFLPKKCGLYDVCLSCGAKWVDFSSDPVNKEIYKNSKVPIAKAIFDADVVISAAKFKTHQLMKATGSIKNMFGTVVGLNKSKQHLVAPTPDEFASLILSIYKLRVPDWSLIDGIIGMEGPGPANGSPINVGLLLASNNGFALDDSESIIMGYKEDEVPIIKVSKKEGLYKPEENIYSIENPKNLVIKNYLKIEAKKTNLFNSLILPFFKKGREEKKRDKRKAPEFDTNKCKLCLRCVEICPNSALKKEDGKIIIDKTKCIRCYCCHEMCPFDAIRIPK